MAVNSLRQVRDDLQALHEAVVETSGVLRIKLETGATNPTWRHLRAAFAGYRAEVDDLRRDLDPLEMGDFLLGDDGAALLQLWTWERGVRAGLRRLARQLRAAEDLAEQLDTGPAARTVVVKSGETWQALAARELGDWKAWPLLLAANPELAVDGLTPGATLTVPERR